MVEDVGVGVEVVEELWREDNALPAVLEPWQRAREEVGLRHHVGIEYRDHLQQQKIGGTVKSPLQQLSMVYFGSMKELHAECVAYHVQHQPPGLVL